ncbi:zinc-dependent metalloprotease [Agilicoccus flavus]|uniref:zinc-dependent metalloprotease n=1 Tax=Agilicoccus flavus TaxID=2775968 RepID=UPI001CF625A8|nr:zinc-dependent metalloprotease [Agilicoccus flavus]
MSQDPPSSPDPSGPDQPDFAKMIQQFLADADNPAMRDALKAMGVDRMDPAAMGMLAGQLRAMFEAAPTDGVNLDLSSDVARKQVAAGGDALVTDRQARSATDAVRVAELWLDAVTELPASEGGAAAWSRAEWVSHTMPMWGDLVGPVAEGVNAAVVAAMRKQMDRLGDGPVEMPGIPGLPPGMNLGAMIGQLEPMLARMSSSMFGAQIGQAVGTLAAHVVSGTEVGLPLVPRGTVVLLPANVAEFADGLEVDNAQVELYLAAREAARSRLFAGAPWLGPQLVAAVQAYARDIDIDTEALESKIASIDASDPAAVQEALGDGLFTPTPSASQQSALARLETLLALVEGWVDVVADRATAPHLPASAALGEAVRRRRATGGPAEQLFSRLVGLELRPRRLRDAANLFAALENEGGADLRDQAWEHPDLAPTAADLDDVLGYVEKRTSGGRAAEDDAFDAALADLLDSAQEDGGSSGPAGSDGPDGPPRPDGPADGSDGPER